MFINKNQLVGKKPIEYVLESKVDNDRYEYKDIILNYINRQNPILIKSKLPQKELDKYIG